MQMLVELEVVDIERNWSAPPVGDYGRRPPLESPRPDSPRRWS